MHRSISSDEDLLREAANYGDVAQAISIKERRTCPRCRSRWRGGTSSGQTGVAKILLDKGADVDAADSDALTPLSYAALTAKHNVADLLVENGADSFLLIT